MTENETVITRLRLKGPVADPLAAQQRLACLLSHTVVDSTILSPVAILCIRMLLDPLPCSLRLFDSSTHPPVAWEHALNKALQKLARSAARPADGHVPANAEAVIFANRSELLSCLALDWCEGRVITRWWWQSLFRSTDVTSALINEWLSSIEYVPAAFAKLAQKGVAVTFAGTLPATAVTRMLDEITRQFGLVELHNSLSLSKGEAQPRSSGLLGRGRVSRGRTKLPDSTEIVELKLRLAPEAFAPELEQNARVLLAVALMLERAPGVLRERDFHSRLLAALVETGTTEAVGRQDGVEESKLVTASATDLQAADHRQVMRPGMISSEPHAQPNEPPPPPQVDEYHPSYDRVRQGEIAAQIDRLRKPGPPRVLPAHPHEDPADERTVPARAEAWSATTADRTVDELPSASIPVSKVTTSVGEGVIETRLGGIFYLINAALAMNLYGDFTTPLQPGIELSIWDFLTLTVRKLSGKRMESDPIWTLLARLAGRDHGERPGSRFTPPREWRMPTHWLQAFPEPALWSYQTGGRRLIVRHPAGFTVLDVKLGSRFRAQDIEARLASEGRCYSNVAGFTRRGFAAGGFRRRKRERGLDRWTRWIADYLRVRLARSLGTGPGDELTAMVFARAARVEVTPARLDVFFSLAELAIEIRLAGLDRDPGWLPAAGRAIAFHYD